jgi:hypothetical protein
MRWEFVSGKESPVHFEDQPFRQVSQDLAIIYSGDPKDSDWVADIFSKSNSVVAARIVACVNACAGIPNEDLERVIGLGKTVKELIRIPQ